MPESNDDFVAELESRLKARLGDEGIEQLQRAFEERAQRLEKQPLRAEARQWLSANRREHPLALNHFGSRADAERFVTELYSAGASHVAADNIDYRSDVDGGGSRSDRLIVHLPADAEQRARLFELCNRDCLGPESTGNKFVDTQQAELHLWWD